MPVKARVRQRGASRGRLLTAARRALAEGRPWVGGDPAPGLLLQVLFGHDFFGLRFDHGADLSAVRWLWEELRDEALTAQARRVPGTRPWAWWAFEAPGARRMIEGDTLEHVYRLGHGQWLGLPTRWGSAVAPVFESQGAYLERLGLLLPGEQPNGQDATVSPVAGLERFAPGFAFDLAAAERVVLFLWALLRHVKGRWMGQPFGLLPWQSERLLRPLFGWVDEEGFRRYRECYLFVPKKNGKSALGSGIALYLLFGDGEPGAEIYSAAADREQAAIVFDVALAMFQGSAELARRAKPLRRELRVNSVTFYKVLSADAPNKHGINAHGVLFDELHAQRNRDLYDTLEGAGAARDQPLHFYMTTAGDDETSICYELHQRAEHMESGDAELDPRFYSLLFGASKKDVRRGGWKRDTVWRQANPSYGVTVKPEYFEAKVAKSEQSEGAKLLFQRLHLNVWTAKVGGWLALDLWDACAGPVPPLEELRGRECYAGLDLSSTRDLSAWVLFFPPRGEEPAYLIPYFWVPGENLKRRAREDRAPYDRWAAQGLVEGTEGNVIDYRRIRSKAMELYSMFDIAEVAFDRHNATETVANLSDEGLTMVPYGQGTVSMSPAIKRFGELVLSRQLHHGGNPVLRWMMSVVRLKVDDKENQLFDKARSSGRIDGLQAAAMAVGRWMVNAGSAGNIYDERGPLVVG